MALKRRVLEELAQPLLLAAGGPRRRSSSASSPASRTSRPTPPSAPWATAAASPGRAGPSGCARGRSPPPTTTRRTGATTSGRSGPPTSRCALAGGGGAAARPGPLPRPAARASTAAPTTSGASRDLFALEASAGAPPDAFFTKGQNWGFPPLQPDAPARARLRLPDRLPAPPPGARGHPAHRPRDAAPPAVLDPAGAWTPRAASTCSYPAEELYAVLSLESHRHRAIVVGENLGTVPPRGLRGHGPPRACSACTWCSTSCSRAARGCASRRPSRSPASTPTTCRPSRPSGRRKDVDDLQSLGFFTPEQARAGAGAARGASARRWRRPCRRRSGARRDDRRRRSCASAWSTWRRARRAWCWSTWRTSGTRPSRRTCPGTHTERPNWRRKARLSLRGVLDRAPEVRGAARRRVRRDLTASGRRRT